MYATNAGCQKESQRGIVIRNHELKGMSISNSLRVLFGYRRNIRRIMTTHIVPRVTLFAYIRKPDGISLSEEKIEEKDFKHAKHKAFFKPAAP